MITIKDISRACGVSPSTVSKVLNGYSDISQKTVERALAEMLKNGEIIKIGGGRYTSYTWNWEKE